MQDITDQFILDILNLIGNIADLIGHQSADLNWDVSNDWLLWEFALSVKLENAAAILGGLHNVTLMDAPLMSDSNIDYIRNLNNLNLDLVFAIGQFNRENDHVSVSLYLWGKIVDLLVESVLDFIEGFLKGFSNNLGF